MRLRIVTPLALIVGLAIGALLDRQFVAVILPPSDGPTSAELTLVGQAWTLIDRHYVDRSAIVPHRLAYGAIAGMVDSLGDTGHSTFLSPDMVKEQQDALQGEFVGIGAEVQMKDKEVVIVAPIDGSPAQAAGLRPGDIIARVDGKDVAGLPLTQVVGRILGHAGTTVTLTLRDAKTGQSRTVSIVRAHITVPSVTWRMAPGTSLALIRIATFSNGTAQALAKALTAVQEMKASGVILDLRNDPGGIFEEAVNVASHFLNGGNVLLVKDVRDHTRPVPVAHGGVKYEAPLAVLVNGGTASAAEIVAGALQDASRAPVIGVKTFGTGTVLKEFPLSDGSALMLAVEEWLTPNGRSIWHRGITPDDVVALPAGVVPLQPTALKELSPTQLRASHDAQLLRAVHLLGSGREDHGS